MSDKATRSPGQGRLHLAAYAVLVLLPWLMMAALLSAAEVRLTDLLPVATVDTQFNDGAFYWHQSATFRAAGLNSGYYTAGEVVPAWSVSRYYTWGLFVPGFYGTIGSIMGFPLFAIPVINTSALSLMLLLLVLIARPSLLQTLVLGAGLLVNGGLWYYLVSSMTVTLNMAFAVGLAACFWRFLAQPLYPRWLWLVTSGLIGVGSLLLPIWALYWLPLLLLGSRQRRVPARLAAAAAGVVLAAAFYGLYQITQAPYPNPTTEAIDAMRMSFPAGIERFAANISENVQRFVNFTGPATMPAAILFVQRAQAVLVLAVMAGMMLSAFMRRRANKDSLVRESAFHLYSLGSVIVLLLVLYSTASDPEIRALAPRLVLSAVLLALSRRYLLSIGLIAIAAITLPGLVEPVRQVAAGHANPPDRANVYGLQQAFQGTLRYDPAAPNGWCSTVLVSNDYLFYEPDVLTALPAGLGISHMYLDGFGPSFRSRYLLLDTGYETANAARLDIEPLFALPTGTLYVNRASACPD